MSEVTPEELFENIEYEVEDAQVIPTPIDPTLTIEGEAADAKATGEAIAAALNGLKVNNKTVSNKEVTIYASDIAMSSESGAQTVAQAIDSAAGRDAQVILFGEESESTETVAQRIGSIEDTIENGVSDSEIDAIFDDWGDDEA